ncbi:MAG: MBOAT family protein, partial [Vicinamibacterales bacterium]
MVFSSQLFLFYFLPAVLLLYYSAPGRRGRHVLLTAASYVFYGWSNPLFVPLLLTSTLIDYTAALVMVRSGRTLDAQGLLLDPARPHTPRQRAALLASIVSNLGLLGFFKYFNFGVDSLRAITESVGLDASGLALAYRVTLPLGISFYTFQSLSYTIDVFRGRTAATRSLLDFACYVSMFPQLVAGPIVRFSDVADQLKDRSHSLEKFARGISFLSLGLAKKVLIANPCGQAADLAFDAASLGAGEAWFGAAAYAFQ